MTEGECLNKIKTLKQRLRTLGDTYYDEKDRLEVALDFLVDELDSIRAQEWDSHQERE